MELFYSLSVQSTSKKYTVTIFLSSSQMHLRGWHLSNIPTWMEKTMQYSPRFLSSFPPPAWLNGNTPWCCEAHKVQGLSLFNQPLTLALILFTTSILYLSSYTQKRISLILVDIVSSFVTPPSKLVHRYLVAPYAKGWFGIWSRILMKSARSMQGTYICMSFYTMFCLKHCTS